MAGKNPADMTDEELEQAARSGELSDVDGSNPNQREVEDDEEEESEESDEEEGSEEETEESEEEESEEESEEETDDDDTVEVGGKKYSKEEYEALISDLEEGGRAVPQSRLMEEVNKRREAEQKLVETQIKAARLEGYNEALAKAEQEKKEAEDRLAKAEKYDFDAKEDAYATLIEEGKRAEATALRREIRAAEHELSEARAEKRAAEAEARTAQRLQAAENKRQLENVARDMYTKYPFLNNESDKADETAILAVIAMRDRLVNEGKSPAQALREACIKIGNAELKKRPAQPAGKEDKKANDKRRAEAIKKGVKTNNKQPPKGGGAGNRNSNAAPTEKDLRKMSDEDFAKLDRAGELPDGRSASQRQRF